MNNERVAAMEDLRTAIDSIISGGWAAIASDEEMRYRRMILGELFENFESTDTKALARYVRKTAEIPLDKLLVAVEGLTRSHPWPSVPRIAEIRKAALYAAGMHRAQYRAGHYLRPAQHWPPTGQRHAIHEGKLEPLGDALLTAGLAELKRALLPERATTED